jgi:hypothetical protein
MTERKPPGVSWETWADKQIREAERRGEFAALPGAGRPLPSLDEPYDELWWVRGKMQREGLSALPPSLVLRKEAEDAMEAVGRAATEAQVRRIVGEINDKLREALRRPPEGPALGRGLFDTEQVVAGWRAAKEQAAASAAPPQPAEPQAPAAGGWRRLFRRRSPA